MAGFDFTLSSFASNFVAGNESENQPGRWGDKNRAVGRFQFDTRHGFKDFTRSLSPYEQEQMIPDPKRREAFLGSTSDAPFVFSQAERDSISQYMTTPLGGAREEQFHKTAYHTPAYMAAIAHSPDPGPPTKEMEALMLDMYTQRGPDKVRRLLAGQGRLTPGQLVDNEISKLDTRKNPGGSATILHRRVTGAHSLDVDINPAHVNRAVAEILNSPSFDKMERRDQDQTLAKLRAVVRETRERYRTTAYGHTRGLNVLADMLGLKSTLKDELEGFAGGLDWGE